MRRAQVREIGALAIGLLFVTTLVVGGLVPLGGLAHASPVSQLGEKAGVPLVKSTSPAKGAPAVAHPLADTASVAYTNTFGKYTQLPLTVTAVISVTSSATAINPHNTSIWMSFYDGVTGKRCSVINDNATVTLGNKNYNFLLDPVLLLSASTCPGIQSDPVGINVTLIQSWPSQPTVQTNVNVSTSLIFGELGAKLLSPSGGVGIGNTTFVASYTAQYLTSVVLLVWNPAKTAILENASLAWTGNTPASVTWFAPAVGTYPYTITVTTAYGVSVLAGNISILSNGGGTVYLSNSSWHNATLLPGVSGAVAGTVLLLAGLIIGMLVALAVGSMMRKSEPAPGAQAWKGETATAPNTCSACGKSFGSADELAAHAKSEHGMS